MTPWLQWTVTADPMSDGGVRVVVDDGHNRPVPLERGSVEEAFRVAGLMMGLIAEMELGRERAA